MLFADIVEFTRFAEGASAAVLVGVLEDISKRLGGGLAEDETVAAGQRSRNIGDAWLAAVDLPDAAADHTIRAADRALDLKQTLERFNQHSRYRSAG